jgi:selenide, water dikinase
MAPGDLDRALCGLDFPTDENVIVGLKSADDAGVYRVSDELALIQTVDFFTPIVDDPYMFGQIAAANALSDVYAMGGIPKTAMNLVAFPAKDMDLSVLREIIQGGIDKLREAGVVLLGGHSIEDKELKYGFSVTGFIHPDKILTKKNLHWGDRLVLTKPLGTGIINTAIKAGLASAAVAERVARQMAALNRDAARVMNDFPVHACTDVTGFGLIGHLAEMVEKSKLSVRIETSRVPLISDALEFAAMGLIPAGAYKNREFREKMVRHGSKVQQVIEDLLYDPQTSGGLLICVDQSHADRLVDALKTAGIDAATAIAEVVEGPEEKIYLE